MIFSERLHAAVPKRKKKNAKYCAGNIILTNGVGKERKMPELPEVETIRRALLREVAEKEITNVNIIDPRLVQGAADEAELKHSRISTISRRGKYLLWELSSRTAVLHLGMTGAVLLGSAGQKYARAELTLDDGKVVSFVDPRRFGKLWLNADIAEFPRFAEMGYEPWDERLNGEYLSDRCGKSRRAVKSCLLDQRVIAGIGNIYSDEICFAAGINPAAPACSLAFGDWERLALRIPQLLDYFIEKNAVPSAEELKADHWNNTPFLNVYGRAGEACRVCGSVLIRSVIGGRGSVYCPKCQI